MRKGAVRLACDETASIVPSGDQAGSRVSTFVCGKWTRPWLSTFATNRSVRPVEIDRRTYAMREPSGDQAGSTSSYASLRVRSLRSPPSGRTVYTSDCPSRIDRNAMRPFVAGNAAAGTLAARMPASATTIAIPALRVPTTPPVRCAAMQGTTRVRALLAAVAATTTFVAAGLPSAVAGDRMGDTRYPEPRSREDRAGGRVALRGKRIRTIRRHVAPGVTYLKIVDRRTPRRIFVIRADVADFPATYDITLAGPALGDRATVPEMARANGALAAINGDFSSRIVGRPIHAFVRDGTFVQSAGPGGASFIVSRNERRADAGPTRQVMTAHDEQNGLTWRIDRWNRGAPGVGEIAAFSAAGGSLETPPDDACYLRLAPDGGPEPAPDGPGLDQRFSVDRSACRADPVGPADGVVLVALPGTDEATQLGALGIGTSVTVHLSLGWRNAFDVLGGDRVLVNGGRRTVPTGCGSAYCRAQPRTGIGADAKGRVLLVVVDGRQRRYSLGLSLLGFARLMKRLGAVEALNLDGGGASTMVVKGDVVNRPSDGSLRHVASAALVLPGPDPGES
jgi:hypothetical protein